MVHVSFEKRGNIHICPVSRPATSYQIIEIVLVLKKFLFPGYAEIAVIIFIVNIGLKWIEM